MPPSMKVVNREVSLLFGDSKQNQSTIARKDRVCPSDVQRALSSFSVEAAGRVSYFLKILIIK
jgi:hypothetical protein